MERIRVRLSDDNRPYTEVLADWFQGHPRLDVVGTALSAPETLEQVPDLRRDLVPQDVSQPDPSGFEVTRRLKALPHAPRVILITLFDSEAPPAAASAAGADGAASECMLTDQLFGLLEGLFPISLVRQRHLATAE